MEFPEQLRYSEEHEWVAVDGAQARIGITDFAQDALGDIVFVELPQVGKALTAGQDAAVVESVKAASDIYAPVAGTVLEVNQATADAPDSINTDAFAAWLFKLKPADAGAYDGLMDADAYGKSTGN